MSYLANITEDYREIYEELRIGDLVRVRFLTDTLKDPFRSPDVHYKIGVIKGHNRVTVRGGMHLDRDWETTQN